MDKKVEQEVLRFIQEILETMNEQTNAILALEHQAWGSNRTFSDGVKDRIERIAQQVRDLQDALFSTTSG